MKALLLLMRADLRETLLETAVRRASALREQRKRAKFEKLLREELTAIGDLRHLMREPNPKRKQQDQTRSGVFSYPPDSYGEAWIAYVCPAGTSERQASEAVQGPNLEAS